MKRTKVYRPRRGVRFSDDPSPSRPVASFIGSVAVTRTWQTQIKKTWTTRNPDSLKISGAVMASLSGPSGVVSQPLAPPPTNTAPVLLSISISPDPAVVT